MKYVSIDIETTGLNPEKHQIIEFAAVIADSERQVAVESLPYCRLLIRHPTELTTGPYCAKLHYKLWCELVEEKGDPVNTGNFSRNLKGSIWVYDLAAEFRKWLDHHNVDRQINVAGKNFAGFDRQFLNKINNSKLLRFRQRVFDPAPLYFRYTDAELPDTNTCLARAGLKVETDHTALSDARNVVTLLQVAMTLKNISEAMKDISEFKLENTPCDIAPPGWACSRGSGHVGPCAARPICDCGHEHDSAMMCNHANEMPAASPCDSKCYCRFHSCKNKEQEIPF